MDREQVFRDHYQKNEVPWDDALPPPEVQALVPTLAPGRALDLGCGYGRASIFMARRGWAVDAVDFVPQAIDVARQRAAAAGVAVNFHVSDVTDLHFLPSAGYDFAVDVGCAHNLDAPGLAAYYCGLERLLKPGACFLLFARLKEAGAEGGPRGLEEPALLALFAAGFNLKEATRGATRMPGRPGWQSAWYLFRRKAETAC